MLLPLLLNNVLSSPGVPAPAVPRLVDVRRTWVARRGGENKFQCVFTENDVAVDITGATFALAFYRIGSDTAALTLTAGSGLTNGGATGLLDVSLTDENIDAYLTGPEYFYVLKYTASGRTYPIVNGIMHLGGQVEQDADPNGDFSVTSGDVTMELI